MALTNNIKVFFLKKICLKFREISGEGGGGRMVRPHLLFDLFLKDKIKFNL